MNNPGTEELMLEALQERRTRRRRRALYGHQPARPDRPRLRDRARIRRRHRHASRLRHTPDHMDLVYVCELTESSSRAGAWRSATSPSCRLRRRNSSSRCAKRLADAGVAVTVLPSTDLYLMGRDMTTQRDARRAAAHKLLHHGVNCSLSTNNVLNPFTPFGDCSLVRMANIYANICQVGSARDTRECFNMVTTRSARADAPQGLRPGVGKPADLAVLDADEPRAGRRRARAGALRVQAREAYRDAGARRLASWRRPIVRAFSPLPSRGDAANGGRRSLSAMGPP